jgi:hypothetical protein
LLAELLEHQRRKVIQLAGRRAYRKHLRAAFRSTLTWPWRALMAPTLIDNSAKPLVGTVPRLESFTKPVTMSHQIHRLSTAADSRQPADSTSRMGRAKWRILHAPHGTARHFDAKGIQRVSRCYSSRTWTGNWKGKDLWNTF